MPKGDCYRANGRLAISHMDDDRWELCHGVGILKSDGKPFGHAWVELGPVVFAHSNGKEKQISKIYSILKSTEGMNIIKNKTERKN